MAASPARAPRQLVLTRPIAFIDLETTGLSTLSDRIIEIGILRITPDGHKRQFCTKINPERGISAGPSNVHGIKSEDVQNKPTFKDIAPRVLELLTECDLAGFNVTKFDLPLLKEEFRRAGIGFSLENRRVIDVKNIYHIKEPRDLTAAYKFYCGADHANAHSAFEDARVSWKILEAQLATYPDLPNTPDGLANFCAQGKYVDSGKWFERRGSEFIFSRGKHAGYALKAVAETNPDYLDWMLGEDIPEDTALLVARALLKKYEGRA